jgi:hypothetical protein
MTSILGALGLAVVAGCGSSAPTRQEARDQATTLTCDRFDECMLIGSAPNAAFPTAEACQLEWRSNWEMAWPAVDCEGKIDSAQFGLCQNAIRATACNVFDFLVTLGKCGKMNVCRTSTPDGG